MSLHVHPRWPLRSGFTLIEVAFSLALVAGAVVTLLALFPMGIRTQNQARFRILAAVKVMEMLETFRDGSSGGNITDGNDLDKEGIMPWDTLMAYRTFAPDLECAIMNLRGGFKPLPNDIAYRLDSDNDEIRKLLDQGGYVFYCTPSRLNGRYDGNLATFDANWLSENRKLLIGVTGLPQQNSILYHGSLKVGPYQTYYPSPPTYTLEQQHARPNQHPYASQARGLINLDALCRDPRAAMVLRWEHLDADGRPKTPAERFGYTPYRDAVGVDTDATGGTVDDSSRKAAGGYVIAALWYAEQVGLRSGPDDPFAITSKNALEAFVTRQAQRPGAGYAVLAMRYLAHAAACLTRHYPLATLGAGVDLADTANATGLPMQVPGFAPFTPTKPVSLALIQAWHECSLRLAIAYAGGEKGPYDWLAPRPLNRQVMMDHPLCQLDLWSQPITADLPAVGGGTNRWQQWRACFPQPIRHPGVPFSYPGRTADTNRDGVIDQQDEARDAFRGLVPYPPRILDCGPGGLQARALPVPVGGLDDPGGVLDAQDRPVPAAPAVLPVDPARGVFTPVPADWQPAVGPSAHFNLTRRFAPSERCRQIVVWSVDWQSYEDFETAPSAPLDSSRYPSVAPASSLAVNETPWTSAWIQWNPAVRQGQAAYRAGIIFSECIRNPEHVHLFREPSTMGFNGEPGYRIRAGERIVRRSDATLTVSDIDNFGGNPDDNNQSRNGFNECEPMSGQSPDMLRLINGSERPMFVAVDDPNRAVNRSIFLGRYGANRNAIATPERYSGKGFTINGVVGAGKERNLPGERVNRYYTTGWVDGGTVPRSVHLRASLVGRFNYYDGRLSGALRN